MADIACPFCGIVSEPAVIQAHVEEEHAEGGPQIQYHVELAQKLSATDPPRQSQNESMPSDEFIKCTRSGCGEYIRVEEIDEHLEVHAAILASEDGVMGSSATTCLHSNHGNENSSNAVSKGLRKLEKQRPLRGNEATRKGHSLLEYFSGSSVHDGQRRPRQKYEYRPPRQVGRLGKRELGPYAFEDSMPVSVRRHLQHDAIPRPINKLSHTGRLVKEQIVENETANLIPLLADLCASDSSTEATYFCSASVRHIRKLYCDGNFCGYWSMQMLLTYLQANGSLPDMQALPNVLEMQDTIERAWSNGICSYGKVETGGIKGTRKWIGTAEAVAFCQQLDISVDALAFKDDEEELAITGLLDYVEAYFLSSVATSKKQGTSHVTHLPPMFFQRRGHSSVIVGVERRKDGSRNLLVFDSTFQTSKAVQALLEGRRTSTAGETLLKAYRKSDQSLARYDEFEIMVPQAVES
ncbi:hypothetical protein B0A50_03426 [Salinomyces thailandicus]|uniref:UFSP1/2/DUB catalytic domain-containing protein n=1 Tax=Salinomyces thailandicus TaxID=706561 RepID=A0A4U0U2M5_9PEZI|nr:hypothetical protein B0A50_03426 [Salinomyces thailandica]